MVLRWKREARQARAPFHCRLPPLPFDLFARSFFFYEDGRAALWVQDCASLGEGTPSSTYRSARALKVGRAGHDLGDGDVEEDRRLVAMALRSAISVGVEEAPVEPLQDARTTEVIRSCGTSAA